MRDCYLWFHHGYRAVAVDYYKWVPGSTTEELIAKHKEGFGDVKTRVLRQCQCGEKQIVEILNGEWKLEDLKNA